MATTDPAGMVLSEHPIMPSYIEKNIYFQLQSGPLNSWEFGGRQSHFVKFKNEIIIN